MRLPQIFRRRQRTATRFEITGAPSTFSTSVGTVQPYDVDVYRSGIDAVARIFAKVLMTPTAHFADGSTAPCDPQLTRLLQVEPNPLMSAYDMLYQVTTHLLLHNNSYCFIERRNGRVVGLWPLHVQQCEYVNGSDGTLWCAFRFANGKSAMLPYSDIVHLRRHFNTGDVAGDPNGAIGTAVQLADAQNRGLQQQIRTSGTITAIVRSKQLLDKTKRVELSDYFASTWLNSSNRTGIVALDESADIEIVKPETVTISSEDQAATAKKVLSYLGVNSSIVDSSFTDDAFSAFEESIIESLALQLSLEATRKIYPKGNRTIEVSTSRISFMSNTTKAKMLEHALPAGVFSVNEARMMLGLPAREEDRTIQSLNFVNVDMVDEYQRMRASRDGRTNALDVVQEDSE